MIGEAGRADVRRFVDIPPVKDHRRFHAPLHHLEIRVLELLPFGHDHYRLDAIQGVVGAVGIGQPMAVVRANVFERFGIMAHTPREYSMALGTGETTPLRLTAAYAMLLNGGKRITPTLIDRIQDREGATICMVTHDPRYARYADRSIHLFDGRVVEENSEVTV